MQRSRAIFVAAILVLLFTGLLAGCFPAASFPVSPIPTPTPVWTAAAVETSPTAEETLMNVVPIPTPLDPEMQAMVTQARDDLARRLSADPAQVELVDINQVTWPDGSLGCPQPGMAYIQMMVDGLRIRLRALGRIYSYHSGSGRPPFLCENEP